MSCLITSPEIRELTKSLVGETEESVKGLVQIWQERNNKSIEEYPTAKELNDLRFELRATPEEATPVDSAFDTPTVSMEEQQRLVDLVFDPIQRRDRVSLITRFFSDEVDKAMAEVSAKLKRDIETTTDPAEKQQKQEQLAGLTRFEVIKQYTPKGIFDRIKNIFESYVSDTPEGRVQAELDRINALEWAGEYSEEEKLAAAQKKAAYKAQEYQKVVDHFNALAQEASSNLRMTEGIRLDPDYVAPSDVNLNEDDPEGGSQGDENADDYSKEESYKDGWMQNVRQVSVYESLSQEVRKAIREVPKLDYEGYEEEDDLGFKRYLDADYVHATLLDKLRNMIDSGDMIPLLSDLERNRPWVGQVRELLEGDEKLFSQFYQDFRKDFMPYWIQKKRQAPDGTFKIETIALNKPEGVYYLLDSWRDNYEAGSILDKHSVYEKNGEINKDNAAIGLSLVEALNNQFINLSTEQRLELLNDQKVWNNIMKALHMIGIDANPSTLRNALTNIQEAPGVTFTDPIMLLLPQLNVIFSGIKKGEVKSETRVDGTVKRGDLINTFGAAYNAIAKMMADVTEDAIESSVRENGKSHYSHVTPSYLGKLIKQLKNVMNDKERFERFMQTEFKDYEWFFKDGHWRSDWIEKLANDSKMREALSHKVVLNHDKIDYQDWDALDYTIVLLNEYWAEPKEGMAWYHVPILSDSPSAEFIRFVRYKDGSEYDEQGNKMSYQDILLDKMVDLVNQEYDRIQLVRQRDAEYQAGNTSVEPIANYDIIRKTNGDIKSLGGAQFKFIPALNDLRFGGETFEQRISALKEAGSGADLKTFIKDTLRDLMEQQFEETYREWHKMGLLDELPNGKYKYLPFNGQSNYNRTTARSLNKARTILGTAWTAEMDALLRDLNNNNPINDRQANQIFEEIKGMLTEAATRGDITLEDANAINRNLVIRNSAKDALREYFWNSKHATSQIIEMTTTDLAFYKNMEDFQKRYKEVHAPSLRMNTRATFHGERIGRDWERTIYLQDDEIISESYNDIKEVLEEKVKKGELSRASMDYILKQFTKVNVADAQAYRSLDSYRAVLGMSGQWTDAMEQAYKNFLDGTWNIEDFTTIWQTKKPYVYTQVNNTSGVEGHTGIKTPVQHKNSEFLLLAMHDLIAGPLGRSKKLRAINKFMQDKHIDVIQFESTTKVGKQGVINLNDVNTEEEVYNLLLDKTGIGAGSENPNVVHKVSYEDYGIQTATPEHAIDAVQLVGTQIRKLITADISPNAVIEVNGRKMSKQEWLDLYNAINTENIIQKFAEINEEFKDPKKVEKILLDEVRGNARYGQDMVRACTLNKNGQFNIPLFDPVQSQRVQTLLNSIIKSRITKQKIKGGALIQVSSYGLSDQLRIVWEGEGENKHIKYLECYMPAYSKEFYKPLMKQDSKGNYYLDVNGLDDDLRKLIGYRVPTEDKYSMAPLYIKGFLPQQNGSSIMLPAEITTLSGSDFDVDKMYIMLPEFRISKYNMRQAREDYAREDALFRDALSMFSHSELAEDLLGADDGGFRTWFKENKERYKYRTPKIRKVKYNFDKLPQEQSQEARNNLLIDMIWGILTNPDTASKIVNPGGFDAQKKAARIMTILNNTLESDLTKALKEGGIKFDKTLNRGGRAVKAPITSYLFDLPLSLSDKEKAKRKEAGQPWIDLDGLTEQLKASIDPLSPRTQVIFHQQNMTGAKLIGIYANHNANHALMQHTELALDGENGSFVLNGRRLTSLHGIQNESKEYISRNNAGFLAASVDNVKDPVLADLNQNTFTTDASMLLSRLGYNPIEIGLLMNQPIIQEITATYFRESREGKGKDVIIDEVLSKYKKAAGITSDLTYDNYKDNQFYAEDLADYIIIAKEMEGIDPRNQPDYRKVEFYSKQVAVGYLFKRIMSSADALSQVVRATRADTQGGAAGPTIADTILKMEKVEDLLNSIATNQEFPLTGADVIEDIRYSKDADIDVIRKDMLASQLPFLQAFYTLGIRQTEQMLGQYFPQYSESMRAVLEGKTIIDTDGMPHKLWEGLRDLTKTGKLDVKTINSVYNDLLAYIMSRNEFFGAGIDQQSGKEISAAERRQKFINQFPEYFKRVVSENEDIAELEFIKRLRVAKANDSNPVDTIIFKNVGQLSSTLKERYMRDWTTLLYMDNPEAQKLALNLFRYSFYRNGFAFGPNTFIHLAPVTVRQAIPGYIETLRSLMSSTEDYEQFVDQYVLNHLDNRRLVPEVPQEATVPFIGEDSEILDEVTFAIDEETPYANKKVVKKRNNDAGEVSYEFFKYIGKRIRGKDVYYKLAESDGHYARYERIAPLGYRNSFIEYEYGKDADAVTSVIKQNDLNYDPTSEFLARFESPSLDDIDLESMPEFDTAAPSFDAMADAFQQVYGTPMEDSNPGQNTFDDFQPNTSFKDANDQEICGGAITLGYL